MGKATGFLEYSRKNNEIIQPAQRLLTFEEFHAPLEQHQRAQQAARCMNCGVPFCQSAMTLSGMVTGCPLHNLIPEWNDQIYEGHEAHAFERLIKTSNFPEFTGRVCPALCEKACICGQFSDLEEGADPVTVHDNELYLIETAFEKGYIRPRIPAVRSGKKVAVVGSGPSGLAVADELNHRGHLVTVYEREERIGGLLMYGIPNMKLDKSVVERRRALMESEGVTFVTGFDVDSVRKAEELRIRYDAVVLCCGAKQARELTGRVANLKGEEQTLPVGEINGVYYAVDFLKSTTESLLKSSGKTVEDLRAQGGYISAAGKDVVVVGGGDTGNDCIATVLRHGCRSVTALEMMSAPPEKRSESNPWPEWPKTLKTDYGHEEAIYRYGKDPRIFETTMKEFIVNKKGELKKIRTVKVAFEGRTLKEIPGTEQVLPCDMLLIAAGFTGCQSYTPQAFSLVCGPRGTVLTQPGHYIAQFEDHAAADNLMPSACQASAKRQTESGGQAAEDRSQASIRRSAVFTAGDMHRGQSLVVWAVAEGRACAKEVDEYLMGYTIL